jgi:hypothetical protein
MSFSMRSTRSRRVLACGAGLAGAPGFDQRCEPLALARQSFHLAGDGPALVGDALAQAYQLGEIGAEDGDLLAQIGHDRAEQHRGAYRFEDVLRPDQHGRRRPATDALERREDFADQAAPALQRTPDRGLARLQEGKTLFERCDASLGALRSRGGVEQGLIELGPVGANAGDLGFQFNAGVGIAGQPLLDRLELGLAAALFLALLLGFAGGLFRIGSWSGLGHDRAG